MINLLSVEGEKATQLYIKPNAVESFKSTIRGIVGGCVFIVSDKFRTDLFFESKDSSIHKQVLKLWLWQVGEESGQHITKDVKLLVGNRNSLLYYFQSLSSVSKNQIKYNRILKTFKKAYEDDINNVLAQKLIVCDTHVLSQHKLNGTRTRKPLFSASGSIPFHNHADASWMGINALLKMNENQN